MVDGNGDAIGFVAEIPFMVLPDIAGWHYTGPIAKQISDVDIAWIVGLIVAGGSYWLLSRSMDVRAEQAAVAASDAALHDDAAQLEPVPVTSGAV